MRREASLARLAPAFAARTAIVTGGASGIGKALGAELVGFGARVVLADVDAPAAERAAQELSGSAGGGGSVVGTGLDVRDGEATQALVEEIAARDGRLDLMFNNAGIVVGGPTHEMSRPHWQRLIEVNLHGVVNGVLAAYPLMVSQGHGHIVNTASGAGLGPAVLTVAYGMTKHAVVGLSTSLRPEAALRGVCVSVICPGAVETPILDKSPPPDLPPPPAGQMTAREFLERVGFSPMPARRFAQEALRGVARNKAVIVAPRGTEALWYLQRLSPGLADRIGRYTVRRVLGEAAGRLESG